MAYDVSKSWTHILVGSFCGLMYFLRYVLATLVCGPVEFWLLVGVQLGLVSIPNCCLVLSVTMDGMLGEHVWMCNLFLDELKLNCTLFNG